MPDTRSEFAALLDDLLTTDADRAGGTIPSVPFDHLAVVEELGRVRVTGDTVEAEYRETMATPGLAADLDSLFDMLETEAAAEDLSIDPADISRELGIGAASRVEELARLRRSFAFKNHPDRVAPHLRDRALTRMKLANMLIDAARRQALAATRR